MKKVALIQDESEFSSEVIYKYMGNIQTLDSSNIIIIYKFIIYNICKNGIYKYVLYVNSKTLDEFRNSEFVFITQNALNRFNK